MDARKKTEDLALDVGSGALAGFVAMLYFWEHAVVATVAMLLFFAAWVARYPRRFLSECRMLMRFGSRIASAVRTSIGRARSLSRLPHSAILRRRMRVS